SQVTPSESSVLKKVAMEPLFLTHLRERLAVKGVRRVILHEPLSNLRKVIFVQYAQNTPRTEVWRGLHGAATLLADCGKICIAVSEDIDPTNTDAVFWSLAYRSNPVEDAHIAPHRSAGHGPKSGPRSEDSSVLIDATLKHAAPPPASHHDGQAFRGPRHAGVQPARTIVRKHAGFVEQHHVVPLRALRLVHGQHIAEVKLVVRFALWPFELIDGAGEAFRPH